MDPLCIYRKGLELDCTNFFSLLGVGDLVQNHFCDLEMKGIMDVVLYLYFQSKVIRLIIHLIGAEVTM